MEFKELKDKIKALYNEIKHHLEGLQLKDDDMNICGQIWFNELTVSEQVDLMIDIKPSQVKKNMRYTCIEQMVSMVQEG